jgi:predicted protein tyrosine phosphatase
MSTMNRLANCKNPYQGKFKKVLCVCSAGLLRSPTTAWVLSQEPFNFNTRAVGIDSAFALIPFDEVLVEWADEIVCMDEYQASRIKHYTEGKKPVHCIKVPDNFEFRDPELVKIVTQKCVEVFLASPD